MAQNLPPEIVAHILSTCEPQIDISWSLIAPNWTHEVRRIFFRLVTLYTRSTSRVNRPSVKAFKRAFEMQGCSWLKETIQYLIIECQPPFLMQGKPSKWKQIRSYLFKRRRQISDQNAIEKDLVCLEDYPSKLPALRNVLIFRSSSAPCFTTENILLPFRGLALDYFSINDDTSSPLFPGCIAFFNTLTLKSFRLEMREVFSFQEGEEKLQLSPLRTLSFNYDPCGSGRTVHSPEALESLLSCTASIEELKLGDFSITSLQLPCDIHTIGTLKRLSLRKFICPEVALNRLISACQTLEFLCLDEIGWTARLFSHLPHSLLSLALSIPDAGYITPTEVEAALLKRTEYTWEHAPLLTLFKCVSELDLTRANPLWDYTSCTDLERKLKDRRKECTFEFICKAPPHHMVCEIW
ncbi:hypothetical protein BT69DRAFT_1281759 [Atractiella rhizophila]|nr:hypothetical protein BT69DRAFT_1281759 [Atractiella rhizophila]